MFNLQHCQSAIERDDFDVFKLEALKLFSCFSSTENDCDNLSWIINSIIMWNRGNYIRWILETTKDHSLLFPFITNPNSTMYGKSALVFSAEINQIDIIMNMIPFVGVQDDADETALEIAIRRGNVEAMRILIEHGALIENCTHYEIDNLQKAKHIEEEYNEKRAACRRAIAALNRVFRRGGAPPDFTRHFLRNYVWTQKRNITWLKETSSQKRLKF